MLQEMRILHLQQTLISELVEILMSTVQQMFKVLKVDGMINVDSAAVTNIKASENVNIDSAVDVNVKGGRNVNINATIDVNVKVIKMLILMVEMLLILEVGL